VNLTLNNPKQYDWMELILFLVCVAFIICLCL